MSPLTAFTGLATCGKSTAARSLVAARGSTAVRLSFADPLRDMLRALGLTAEQLTVHKNEPIAWCGGKTARALLQSLGTEWGRELVSPDLWAGAMERRILEAWDVGHAVVIDDCRFDNEARMVRRLGGRVVEIERPGLVRLAHASERGVAPELIDARICNDGDQPQFVARVLALADAPFPTDPDEDAAYTRAAAACARLR